MIKWIYNGDIFNSKHLIVVPVNCVGVMGAGLARKVKDLHPSVFRKYQQHCSDGQIKPGYPYGMYLSLGKDGIERWFIMLATKDHWSKPSKIEWIEKGIENLKAIMQKDVTVAIPAIGCGLGGLNWGEVKSLLEKYLSPLKTEAEVYCPHADV